MIDIRKEIGRKLKEARREMEYSQEEVADQLGLSKVGYGAFERGDNLISIEYLLQLPRILDRPITYFLPDSAVSPAEKQNPALDPFYQEVTRLWTELDRVGREFVRNAARAMHERCSALRGLQPQLRLVAEDTMPYNAASLNESIADLVNQIPALQPLFDEARQTLPEHAIQALIYNVQIWIQQGQDKKFGDLHRQLGDLLTT